MRIGFISTFELPSAETSTEQVVRTVDALDSIGVTVDLVSPCSKAGLNDDALCGKIRHFYGLDGAIRVTGYRGIRPLALEAERMFHAMALFYVNLKSYDLVHTRSRAAVIVSLLKGKRVVFETYRCLPKMHPVFMTLVRRLLKLQNFLGIICHSQYSAQSILSAGTDPEKVTVVYNGYSPHHMLPRMSREEARSKLGLPEHAKIAVYTGNVQTGKGMSHLLSVAERTPEIDWIIVGGQQRHIVRLQRNTHQAQRANVTFVERQRPSELAAYLYSADVLVIPPTSQPLEHYGTTVLPMKTFLYMAAGRPILAPDTPDIREILVNDETALLVEPNNVEAARDTLQRLFCSKELQDRLSESCNAQAARYTWTHRADSIKKLYASWTANAQFHDV